MDRKSWDEFKDTGLLWLINSILHLFGWCICIEYDDGNIDSVYPARTIYRGFDEETNTKNYKKITEYLKDNIDDLKEEIEEE